MKKAASPVDAAFSFGPGLLPDHLWSAAHSVRKPQNGFRTVRCHSSDVVDVTTAQTDIVKLAVGQFAQGIAGHATVIPVADDAETVRYKLDKAVGGDSAKRRRAGRVGGGHGGYPFLKLLIGWAFLPGDSHIILLHAHSNLGLWQACNARHA